MCTYPGSHQVRRIENIRMLLDGSGSDGSLVSLIGCDFWPGPAGHCHPALAALAEEPPPVEILDHGPVTEDLAIPDTLWTADQRLQEKCDMSIYSVIPPPAFGQPGAMSDFFLSLSFPSTQILTRVLSSLVTAPSQICLPSKGQLASVRVRRTQQTHTTLSLVMVMVSMGVCSDKIAARVTAALQWLTDGTRGPGFIQSLDTLNHTRVTKSRASLYFITWYVTSNRQFVSPQCPPLAPSLLARGFYW